MQIFLEVKIKDMILSDKTIKEYIDSGRIQITPEFYYEDITPAGVRVYLGPEALVAVPGQTVSLTNPTELIYEKIDLTRSEGYLLEPGAFILAATQEKFCTSRDLLIFLDGRSTVARLGLTTHITAAVIDGKYEIPKSIVLEMKNLGNFNIVLHAGDPIGNVYFEELSEEVEQEIQDRYKVQDGVRPPNLFHKPNGRE